MSCGLWLHSCSQAEQVSNCMHKSSLEIFPAPCSCMATVQHNKYAASINKRSRNFSCLLQLYGDSQAEQVLIPYRSGQLEARQDNLTTTLLNALELGINIFVDKGSIYVLRRCK